MNEQKNETKAQEISKDTQASSLPGKKLLVVKTGFKAGVSTSQNLTAN